jgi:hypothetical protein
MHILSCCAKKNEYLELHFCERPFNVFIGCRFTAQQKHGSLKIIKIKIMRKMSDRFGRNPKKIQKPSCLYKAT